MIKLNVPTLSQRDPRWASQRLGTVNGTTIGGYGCLVTSMCMIATYYGHAITPDQMDNWLTANQGYVQGNLYRNDAFPREFSDCTFDKVIACTSVPAPLDQIDAYLQAGKPVIIMVDFDHDPNDGIQTHFVVIIGKDDQGNYLINDPWYGDQVYLIARYGTNQAQAINQINLFSGPLSVPAPAHTTMYKGYDLSNQDSMKVAIDVLVRVQAGEFVEKVKYDTDINALKIQFDQSNGKLGSLQTEFDTYKSSHPDQPITQPITQSTTTPDSSKPVDASSQPSNLSTTNDQVTSGWKAILLQAIRSLFK